MLTKQQMNALQALRPELQEIYAEELRALGEGKISDSLLIQATAHNWSFGDFMKVARWRGKSYRFLSALSDKSLEIQGVTMLNLMTLIEAQNLSSATIDKTISAYHKFEQREERYQHNPRILRLIEEGYDEVDEARRISMRHFWEDIGKMRGR